MFDNAYVLARIEQYKQEKQNEIIQTLRPLAPSLKDDELLQLYTKSISIHQKKIQGNGAFLENLLTQMLQKIPYQQQVTIDKKGIVQGIQLKGKCYHILDFVIGEKIEVGSSITEYVVISCKTTCRERWTQDDWSFTFMPKLYLLITLSDDYPRSDRFRESPLRKIVTCCPKGKDDRLFPLNFEDVVHELTMQEVIQNLESF